MSGAERDAGGSRGALAATRLAGGIWEGLLPAAAGGEPPRVSVTHEGRAVPAVTVVPGPGGWVIRVPVPPETIADGVQTYLVAEEGSGVLLGSFALVAGEALALDLRAEIDLLRAELDMLKKAFRRHCLETGG